MWCYLVNEIVIIAVNLDQSPLLLDIHYALLTHKLLFGYNNSGSGLFGKLRFFLGIYIRIQYIAIIKTVRTISTAIHLCVLTLSYCFLSIIQLLACISTGFILFFSDVRLSDSHRLEQFLAATTMRSDYRVCEMVQGLTSTYSHKHAHTKTNYVSLLMQQVCQRECS